VPAIKRALAEAEEHRARKKAEAELREALRTLEERVKIRTAELKAEMAARNKTEVALRESEARFRSMFEHSMDAMFLTTPGGRVLAANPAAYALFGMTEEELIRAGRQGLADPADERHAVALAERVRTGRMRTELRYVRKDGTAFTAEVESVVLGNEPDKLFLIMRDITARKRAEEELQRS